MLLEIIISNKAYQSFYIYMNPLPWILLYSLWAWVRYFSAAGNIGHPAYVLPFLLITPFFINRFKKGHGQWWVLAGFFRLVLSHI